jgi:hypothetical protein
MKRNKNLTSGQWSRLRIGVGKPPSRVVNDNECKISRPSLLPKERFREQAGQTLRTAVDEREGQAFFLLPVGMSGGIVIMIKFINDTYVLLAYLGGAHRAPFVQRGI